jgi:UPF0716 protein FxsA
MRLFFLFALIPLIETLILIRVGSYLGFWNTLGLIIVTALIGVSLARSQGIKLWIAAQSQLQQGHIPGDKIIEGIAILIASILLLTPGILTDLVGFALLTPPLRKLLAQQIKTHMKIKGFTQPTNRSNAQGQAAEPDYEIMD